MSETPEQAASPPKREGGAAAPEVRVMPELATAPLTLKRQRRGAAALLAALECGWLCIRERHPDVPAAQIIVAQGSRQRGGLVLGHLAADRGKAPPPLTLALASWCTSC